MFYVIWVPICLSVASLLIQISDDDPKKAVEEDPSTWIADIHVGDSNDAPGSCYNQGRSWP